jgi:hypothetical protein
MVKETIVEKYKVVIPDSTWTMNADGTKGPRITKWECDHDHRTYSGARRCLDKLSVYYDGGGHNEIAHYGTVWVVDKDRWARPVDQDVEMEYLTSYFDTHPV